MWSSLSLDLAHLTYTACWHLPPRLPPSSPHPLPRQAGICPPLTFPIAQLQSKPHTALDWIPQWVPFSPYAGSSPSTWQRWDWGISKCGSVEDSGTPLCWSETRLIFRSCQVAWSQRRDGGWGAEFLQCMTDAQNRGVGPVILLKRVQMEKLNDSWAVSHPRSGQCGRRKPGETEEGTGRCC